MAAILPFLEQQDDPAEDETTREALSIPADLSEISGTVEGGPTGLGRTEHGGEIFDVSELNAASLNKSHAELLSLAWLRESLTQALINRHYRVQAGDIHGQHQDEVFIVLDGPIVPPGEFVTPWSPPGSGTMQQVRLLSWTAKMGSPSFSLPAGPIESGGACPGATAGQSIVPVSALRAASRRVSAVLGKPVRLQQAICQHCYAEGGNYAYASKQAASLLVYIWARNAIANGTFVETMSYAVNNADYLLDGGSVGSGKEKKIYKPERQKGRYFRIHDSGDFFSADYLAGWRQVADLHPDITFWAPSRIWATSWGIEAVNEINDPRHHPDNLIIRPSAYHTNEYAPERLGPGWARGSVVYSPEQKAEGERDGAYNFDCQAYAVENQAHSCRNAIAPDGREGCRACWRHGRDLTINYTLH